MNKSAMTNPLRPSRINAIKSCRLTAQLGGGVLASLLGRVFEVRSFFNNNSATYIASRLIPNLTFSYKLYPPLLTHVLLVLLKVTVGSRF